MLKYLFTPPTRASAAVIVHFPCNDGFGAAWAASHVLPLQDTLYIAHTYANGPISAEDLAVFVGKRVFICDYSLPIENLIEMSHFADSITVLDHHKTFKEAIGTYLAQKGQVPSPQLGDSFTAKLSNKITVVFDEKRSGAMITWDHFHPTTKRVPLIDYVGFRDLWKKDALPGIDEIHTLLGTVPMTFENWSTFNAWLEKDTTGAIDAGRSVLAMQKMQVARAIENVMWGSVGGHRVPIVNTAHFTSEIGNALVDKYPESHFAAVYFDKLVDGEVMRIWSLRGRGSDDFDCSVIAKGFGGGGHAKACGFQTHVEDPSVHL